MVKGFSSSVGALVAICITIAWTVWGMRQGVPLAVNELEHLGIIEIGNPGFWGMLVSIVLLLIVFPFWIGLPLYGFFLISLVKDGQSFSQAIQTSLREYVSTAVGAATFLLIFLILATIGRAVFTALWVGAFFAFVVGLLFTLGRGLISGGR